MGFVVAGVDLTAMGRRVADRARIVAEGLGDDLHLVHALEPLGEAMIEPGLARVMREHQKEQAEKLAAWCEERSSVPVELEVVKGTPSWELTSRAKNADLVVVGSSTIDAFTSGPVARRVARKAGSDVLVVRRQPRVPYRRIIAAVDFSEASRVTVNRVAGAIPGSGGDSPVLASLPFRHGHGRCRALPRGGRRLTWSTSRGGRGSDGRVRINLERRREDSHR